MSKRACSKIFYRHTGPEPVLDFRLESRMALVQGSYTDPQQPEFAIHKILGADPPKIQTPGTLRVSHGTKKISSNFLSQHICQIISYAFCRFVLQKLA